MRPLAYLISFALFIATIIALYALTMRGIGWLIHGAGLDQWWPLLRTLYIAGSMILPVVAIRGFISLRRDHSNALWAKLAINGFLTQLITQLVFVAVWLGISLAGYLFQGLAYLFSLESLLSFFQQSADTRLFVALTLAASAAGLVLVAFIYGSLRGKYRYRVHRHVLHFDDLPEAFDGFTITQISDIHSGSFGKRRNAIQRGIDLINQQQSDLFLFTGDLVNNLADEIKPWKTLFQHIRAPFGQYSVLGNHDYGDYVAWPSREDKMRNLQNLLRHQEEMGFRPMLDEHITLEKEGQQIVLIGIHNWGHGFSQYGDLDKALSGVKKEAFKILMSHDPSHFEHQVKNHPHMIHLTLSGHTHGMQMGVEFRRWKWSPIRLRYRKWAGLYRENGRYLHINRGFGYLGFSGRVGIWPEVTVLELRKQRELTGPQSNPT